MIQIDMEMPAKCSECRMQTDYDYCSAMPRNFCGNTEDDGKPEWCPLKEVPVNGGWISMETPPKEDGEYITKTNAYGKSKGVISQDYVTRTVRGKQIRRWEWNRNNRVSPWITTHWMPLPEPPKEDTK